MQRHQADRKPRCAAHLGVNELLAHLLRVAAAAVAALLDVDLQELRAEARRLLRDRLARVKHPHDGAHRFGGADGREAGNAAADDQHLRIQGPCQLRRCEAGPCRCYAAYTIARQFGRSYCHRDQQIDRIVAQGRAKRVCAGGMRPAAVLCPGQNMRQKCCTACTTARQPKLLAALPRVMTVTLMHTRTLDGCLHQCTAV